MKYLKSFINYLNKQVSLMETKRDNEPNKLLASYHQTDKETLKEVLCNTRDMKTMNEYITFIQDLIIRKQVYKEKSNNYMVSTYYAQQINLLKKLLEKAKA